MCLLRPLLCTGLLLGAVPAHAGEPVPSFLNDVEPILTRLGCVELLPGNRILKVGQELALNMRATFDDGNAKDVTWLTQFAVNDASVAEVSPAGTVKMLRAGETAVRATFQGHVAVVTVTAP